MADDDGEFQKKQEEIEELDKKYEAPSAPDPLSARRFQRLQRVVGPRPPGTVAGYHLADIQWRLASGMIDFIIAFVLPSVIFSGSWKLYGWWLMIGFGVQLVNGGVLAAWTGQSIGKKITKQYLVQERKRDVGSNTIGYLPLHAAILRVALHWVDAYTFVGFLLPYWAERRSTIADRIVHSYVVRDRSVAVVPIRPTDGQLVW